MKVFTFSLLLVMVPCVGLCGGGWLRGEVVNGEAVLTVGLTNELSYYTNEWDLDRFLGAVVTRKVAGDCAPPTVITEEPIPIPYSNPPFPNGSITYLNTIVPSQNVHFRYEVQFIQENGELVPYLRWNDPNDPTVRTFKYLSDGPAILFQGIIERIDWPMMYLEQCSGMCWETCSEQGPLGCYVSQCFWTEDFRNYSMYEGTGIALDFFGDYRPSNEVCSNLWVYRAEVSRVADCFPSVPRVGVSWGELKATYR